MTLIENLPLSKRLTICADRNSQLELFEQVRSIISNGGISQKSLDAIANLPIDGLSVRKIIQLNIDEGNLKDQNGLIIPNRKSQRDTFQISRDPMRCPKDYLLGGGEVNDRNRYS